VRLPRAGYLPTLVLTFTLAAGLFLILMAALLLVVHPPASLVAFSHQPLQQRQSAKTLLYVVTFLVILPVGVILVPRVADRIAGRLGDGALSLLSAGLFSLLAAILIIVRLSRQLPWGDGLGPVLVGLLLWWLAALGSLRWATAGLSLRRASAPAQPRPVRLAGRILPAAWALAGGLAVLVLLCLTSTASLHVVPLVAGGALGLIVLVMVPRAGGWRARRWLVHGVDVLAVIVIALAVANVVVYRTSGHLPTVYQPPGVIQDQQNYLLGSANQLLGGGALLVNVPVSQYGVGMIYFLDGWFHLVPIGYGTLGALDSILTALFYVGGYLVLRFARIRPRLAVPTLAVAVVGLILALHYPVGDLPETGPLRFGLPLALVLATMAAERWPGGRRAWELVALAVLALASVWAFEAFAYTLLTALVVLAVLAWAHASAPRRGWVLRRLAAMVGACLLAHLLLALLTLAATGSLPDWGQYFTYLRSFLLGGRAGVITFPFAPWSPGLAVGACALGSALALLLLVRRAPQAAARDLVRLVGLAGLTAYLIALLSYTDNRSATYLLPYVALPLVLLVALWLSVVLSATTGRAPAAGRGALGLVLAAAVLLISSAWPAIHGNFEQSALAHAYPGGGLRAAVHRLWNPPAIDPRAPDGVRLLRRYMPGRRALILLPTVPDLSVEILMRSHRTSSMFMADPIDDGFVPSVWLPKLRAQVARLQPRQRVLLNTDSLRVLRDLRAHPNVDPSRNPLDYGDQEDEWLLRAIDRRFVIRPLFRDPDGLIVASLARRPAGAPS
jgi:hypothetical protein